MTAKRAICMASDFVYTLERVCILSLTLASRVARARPDGQLGCKRARITLYPDATPTNWIRAHSKSRANANFT